MTSDKAQKLCFLLITACFPLPTFTEMKKISVKMDQCAELLLPFRAFSWPLKGRLTVGGPLNEQVTIYP